MKSFVTLSDIHYPFEDKDAMKLVTKFLQDFHPDTLYLNGDIYDMPQISKYAKKRTELLKETSLQDHLTYGNEQVAQLIDASGTKDVKFALGNHENRWELYLGTEARALASLHCLEFEQVFNLKGIDWKKYGDGFWANDSLFIYHGSRIGTNWTEQERQDTGASTITGHKHQQRVTYFRDRSRTYKNIAEGCLCDLDVPYLTSPPNWTQGFVYGYIIDESKFRAFETEIVTGEDSKWMMPEKTMYKIGLTKDVGRIRTTSVRT